MPLVHAGQIDGVFLALLPLTAIAAFEAIQPLAQSMQWLEVSQAAANRTPHTLVHYLRELANAFHAWYNAATFIVEEPALRNARLALALGVQQVVRNGLALLGVSAPESM